MNSILSNDRNHKQSSIPFTFPAPTAREVSLAGDFNKWDPKAMPMRKGADGVWHLNVTLTPGRHEYRFVADGVWQDDPAAQHRTANTLGGENCVKIVTG
jgi:1,4-alpha-glucan branching enzyme